MSTAIIWVWYPAEIVPRETRCFGDGVFLEAHVEHVLH